MSTANIYDTGLGDNNIFQDIQQSAQFTFNENALLRQLVTVYDMTGTPGLVAQVPVYPKVTGLTALAAGADLGDSDIADVDATAVEIAAAEFATFSKIQDIVIESSPLSVAQDVGRVLGDAVAQAMDTTITGLFTSATSEAGPGASNELTAQHLMAAAATLRNNSVPMTGLVAVLNPFQAYNVKKTLLNAGGSFGNNNVANEIAANYFVGRIGGIDVYESASIDVDSDDDAIGAVFHPAAIGMVMKRDLRIALERDESLRGFEVVASGAWGAAILDANKIVKLTSDAAV